MNRVHYELWERCRAFVADACAGRDASHGLAHMENVTEQALLLFALMEHKNERAGEHGYENDANATYADATTDSERAYVLYRIILVGMLHDVADHKYDHDGTLEGCVRAFVGTEATRIAALAEQQKEITGCSNAHASSFLSARAAKAVRASGAGGISELILTSLKAISYSTEKRQGVRWFIQVLSPDWCLVRDCVSDADKLDAIGEVGMLRCYEFTIKNFRCKWSRRVAAAHAASAASESAGANSNSHEGDASGSLGKAGDVERALLQEVSDHYDEKLSRLLLDYIVTGPGKFLGQPRHAQMATILKEWKAHGPPPITLYWRDAPVEG